MIITYSTLVYVGFTVVSSKTLFTITCVGTTGGRRAVPLSPEVEMDVDKWEKWV